MVFVVSRKSSCADCVTHSLRDMNIWPTCSSSMVFKVWLQNKKRMESD